MLEEQNQNLKALFQWLIEKGLNQNKSKCEFRKDKLEFFGYFFFFFLLTEIFITTTSLTTLSLQNLRLQKITIKN